MTTNPPNFEQQDRYITIWSKVIDTQMHFNELSVKSRQLGITSIIAALGVAIVLVSRGNDFAFSLPISGIDVQVHVSVLLFFGAWLALQAVKILDLNVYHKMLRGAVAFCEDFEEVYMKQIFHLDKGMTQAISHFSRYKDAKICSAGPGAASQYIGDNQVTAEQKIRNFYKWTGYCIIAGSILIFAATNFSILEDIINYICENTPMPSEQASKEEIDIVNQGKENDD